MGEMKEKLDDIAEEVDGSDRRDFLKTAAKAAGALAIVSAIGALSEDEAGAQVRAAKELQAPLRGATAIGGAQLKLAKTETRKQFGIAGAELGKVLQNEGFIPSRVKNIENAALHVSVSW